MKLLICTQAVDQNHPILGFFIGWIKEFALHFDEVHVICLQKGVYDLPPHVHVYSLGKEKGESKPKYLYRFYTYFGHIFLNLRVDYVFFHMGAVYNILAAPFFFVRSFFHTKFYWWKAHGHINFFGKLALIFVDKVYTSTESGFPIYTPKRNIIGQAIDTAQFVLPAEDSRKNEIIFVGRIMPVKHIEDFVAVAKLLVEQDKSLTFKIIGPVGDEHYYQHLQQEIASRSLSDAVVFLGPKSQQELAVLYTHAKVFLNTSLTHSMDKTVLEAVLSGCIPVTANKAFVDLLEPERLYYKDATPEQYAAIVRRLIESDNRELQSRLRTQVVALHSLSTFSHRIFNT